MTERMTEAELADEAERVAEQIAGDPTCCDISSSSVGAMAKHILASLLIAEVRRLRALVVSFANNAEPYWTEPCRVEVRRGRTPSETSYKLLEQPGERRLHFAIGDMMAEAEAIRAEARR